MSTGGLRSALVSGASRGIGRATAVHLAEQGYGLTITSRRESDLDQLVPVLLDAGAAQVVRAAADMADHSTLQPLVDLHGETFGTMSALVVNAGVGTAGEVATFPTHRLHKTLDVNLIAPFVLVQAALPLLRQWAAVEPRGAKIVALSSITGVYAEEGLAAYGASKAGLLSLVETLNREEGPRGISAAAIAPGYVDTDMSAWTTDTVPADTMISTADVVRVIDMLLGLGRNASIPRIVMSRTAGSPYQA